MCDYEKHPTKNPDTLFYFHGAGKNAQSWGRDSYTKELNHFWHETAQTSPRVISISFGESWIFSNAKYSSTDLAHMWIAIAQRFKLNAKGKIIFLGESLGAMNVGFIHFNRIMTASKIALLCPPLFDIHPWFNPSEMDAYIRETGASRLHIEWLMRWFRDQSKNLSHWKALDLGQLIEEHLKPGSTSFYLSCGIKDEFGFHTGTRYIASVAQERGVNATFKPTIGGHCAVDIKSLSEFILH